MDFQRSAFEIRIVLEQFSFRMTHYNQKYETFYRSHANSSIIGRGLTKWGVMRPGVPEVVIPGYKSDLQNELSGLDKK